MGLFTPNYLKEGPGISKDAPPKKGVALFVEILGREFWQVVKLNLMFLICCLPVVTFGPARAALARCTMNMVRDQPNDVWYDFREEIKHDFLRNLLIGLVELVLIVSSLLSFVLSLLQGNAVLCGIELVLMLLILVYFGYLWPMLVTIDLPVSAAVRNTTALVLACLQHSLPAGLLSGLIMGGCLWYFPVTLPVMLLLPFALHSFILSFAAWSDIRRLVVKAEESDSETQKNGL
ncbi:MAG: DUF624 domain-containing protein [Butyricicoccus sp.]